MNETVSCSFATKEPIIEISRQDIDDSTRTESRYQWIYRPMRWPFALKVYVTVILICLICLISLACCALRHQPTAVSISKQRTAYDLMRDMNMSTDPCDDFYEFACGKWFNNVPDRYNSANWYQWIQQITNAKLYLFFKSQSEASEPMAIKEMRTMHKACMNMNTTTVKMENVNAMFVKYLKELDFPLCPHAIQAKNTTVSSTNKLGWPESVAKVKKFTNLDSIIGFDIIPDPNRSFIFLGPLKEISLLESFGNVVVNETDVDPDDLDETIDEIFQRISDFVAYSDLKVKDSTEIRNIIKKSVEFKLAIYKFAIEAYDENNGNQSTILLTLEDFEKSINSSFCHEYLNEIFRDIKSPSINLNERTFVTNQIGIDYLKKVTKLIAVTPEIDLNFFIWIDFVYAILELYGNISEMNEIELELERDYKCMLNVVGSMPMAAAYAIIERNFFEDTKPKIEIMINNIRLAFHNSIEQIDWIDFHTKKLILEKANAMKIFVGVPEWIHDAGKLDQFYSGLKFSENSYAQNIMNYQQWTINRKLKSMYSIEYVDWPMIKPTSANAINMRPSNAIYLPFVTLQYPFYDLGIDALNYGAIGWTLGHEFIHGFDSEGLEFNKNGQQLKWWSNKTVSEFENRTKCLIDQYDKYYVPEADENINGTFTLAENIADNGGLRQAFYAYKLHMNSNQHTEQKFLPGLEKFTHDQLFFLSFAHSKCGTVTFEKSLKPFKDDHAPLRFRVNGPLVNSAEFRKAFNCPPESKMISKDQCRIW